MLAEELKDKNIIGYSRLSQKERTLSKSEKESSLKNTKEQIELFCKSNQCNLIKFYEDKKSGSDRKRKEFNSMIDYLLKSDCSAVIIKDSDRFCRDSSFQKDLLKRFKAYDKTVYSIIEAKFLDFEDLGDNIKAELNEHYLVENRKKTRNLFELKAMQGLPVTKAPYGYKNKNHKWIIVPEEAEKVRLLYSMLNHNSYKEIIKELGLTKKIYYGIIKNIKNDIYNGYCVYNEKVKDENGLIVKTKLIKYKGNHESIL